MKLFDALKMALKNLWRRKLRTVLTIFAVGVGVTAVVSLVAIALGAQNALVQQFESIGMLSKINVVGIKDLEAEDIFQGGGSSEDSPDATKLTDDMISQISELNNVRGVYPDIGIWSYRNFKIQVNDQDKWLQAHISSAPYTGNEDDEITLAAGRFFNSNDEENVIIIGNTYLETLNKTATEMLGQEITLVSYEGMYGYYDELPDPEINNEDAWKNHRSEIKTTIIGVTNAGPSESSNYISVNWAKKLMMRKEYKWPDQNEQEKMQEPSQPTEELFSEIKDRGYDSISVYINDVQLAEQTATEIEDKFAVSAFTMDDLMDQINKIFKIIEIVLGAIGSISLGVSAIGIINTMIMSIYERTREIGVMKAVGASRSAIRKLFTIEASLIGFFGGALGLGFGYILSLIANTVANKIMTSESIPLTDIIQLPLYLTLGVLAFSTIIGTLAGLYPAWRASRLNPIEALHNE